MTIIVVIIIICNLINRKKDMILIWYNQVMY